MRRIHHRIVSNWTRKGHQSDIQQGINEFLIFGYKNAISCIFPAFIFLMLGVSKLFDHSLIARYDFLLIVCILAQIVLYAAGVESKREVVVICIFHILGLILELHKVNVGSWSYPEEALTKVAGVPLYSGFMYASVASYICRAWKNFDLKLKYWPNSIAVMIVGGIIYLNFFTNSFLHDIRWFIVPILIIVFWKTKVRFKTNGVIRQMPMLLSFVLIGFFIWLAENIATFLGAWKYTYQHENWQAVDVSKLSSWSLLVIVSVIIVGQLKRLGNER